jgi:LmbE family N-acetylglucosaminyl deacetylase
MIFILLMAGLPVATVNTRYLDFDTQCYSIHPNAFEAAMRWVAGGKQSMGKPVAFAVAAHPDDIEFMMSGTLMLLGGCGFELHVMNVANGNCGSAVEDGPATAARRLGEAHEAAAAMGATLHPPLANDLEILYSLPLLRRLAAVLREVRPTVLLTQSPADYMEDHMITSRLAVTAAFSRGMRNFITDPETAPVTGDVALYHALPYGLGDGFGRPVRPDFCVDVESVLARKRAALACHRSQKEWLDTSQGLDSYLVTMEDMCREAGRWSGRFNFAEGWRRHAHLGFHDPGFDPIAAALGQRVGIALAEPAGRCGL